MEKKIKGDVIIIGGGPAGIIASVASSRLGAKTVLIERYGFLGGNMTNAGVINIRTFNDGKGNLVIKGIPYEFVNEIKKYQKIFTPGAENLEKDDCFRQYPEVTKYVSQEFVLSSNVELILHGFVNDVIKEKNKIKSVVIFYKGQKIYCEGDVFIDCTGDGDVAYLSGADFIKGWEEGNKLQPLTTTFIIGGVSKKHWPKVKITKKEMEKMKKEFEEGSYPCPTYPPGALFPMPRKGEIYGNVTRYPADITDIFEMTKAEIELRRQVWKVIEFYRKYMKGFEKIYLQQTFTQAGGRESRRIIGEYILKEEDILECKNFPDNIAKGSYPIDILIPDGPDIWEKLKNSSYGIPYRCLVPKKIENLLVAGRCISCDYKALGAIRVMAICMATGQAAGVSAYLSSKKKISPRELEIKEIQEILKKQEAIF